MSVDYYALLGVPKFCSSQDEIRRAYLAQARFFHPDAGNVSPEIAHQKMQQLNTIYDTLKDPDARRLYDAKLLSPVKAEASPSFSTSPAPPTQPPRHASRAPSRFKQTVVALASIAATLFGCLALICISSQSVFGVKQRHVYRICNRVRRVGCSAHDIPRIGGIKVPSVEIFKIFFVLLVAEF